MTVTAILGSELVGSNTFEHLHCQNSCLDVGISARLGSPDADRFMIMDHNPRPEEWLHAVDSLLTIEQVVFMAAKVFLHHVVKSSLMSPVSG